MDILVFRFSKKAVSEGCCGVKKMRWHSGEKEGLISGLLDRGLDFLIHFIIREQ